MARTALPPAARMGLQNRSLAGTPRGDRHCAIATDEGGMQLGVMKSVAVNQVWISEDRDLNAWICGDGRAALLEAMQIDPSQVGVVGQQVPVGPFFADIVMEMGIGENRSKIVIELQITKSDHDHIGKALTYASYHDAAVVVWIAPHFRPEHVQAIKWLNSLSTSGRSFFAVRLEAWRIESAGVEASLPAPRFEIEARPTDWPLRPNPINETGNKQGWRPPEFWTGLNAALQAINSEVPRVSESWGMSRYPSLGVPDCNLYVAVPKDGASVQVGVYLGYAKAKPRLSRLNTQKAQIESELGHELTQQLIWPPVDDNKLERRIFVQKNGLNLDDNATWPPIHSWIAAVLDPLYRAFKPRITAIQDQEAKELIAEGDESDSPQPSSPAS
jgi:Domain of unknown function (DUF4268)